MGYITGTKASVTSHIGVLKGKNENNFYLNGRFMYEHETDNIQVYTEGKSDSYIFSVSDCMDIADKDKRVTISVTREIKKYHEKLKNNDISLSSRIEQLSNIVKETSELIKSIYSEEEHNIMPSFASLLIKDDKASVVSLGNCKVFIIREGEIKQLTMDWEKTQRLLNLGVITKDQASDLANRFGIPTQGSINDILKSDEFSIMRGDIFILATSGLTNSIEIEDINETFKLQNDIGASSNILVKNALTEKKDDNITIMAVKIEKSSGCVKDSQPVRKYKRKYSLNNVHINKLVDKIKKIKINKLETNKIYAIAIIFIFLLTFTFAGAKIIKNKADKKASLNLQNSTTQSSGTSTSDNETDGTIVNSNTDNNGDVETPENNENSNQDNTQSNEKLLPALYTIKKGDTLHNISKYFYNDSQKYKIIMDANNIKDPSKIQIGQVLEIPDIRVESE